MLQLEGKGQFEILIRNLHLALESKLYEPQGPVFFEVCLASALHDLLSAQVSRGHIFFDSMHVGDKMNSGTPLYYS